MAKKRKQRKRETLLQATIRHLKDRDESLTYSRIAKKTGVSTAVLSTLVSDEPPRGPSVDSIQKLYEFLTGDELQY